MSISTDRVISKMKKLLAMSEGNANEHESMVAARQLHSMLAKHNISMSQLTEEEDPIDKESILVKRSRPWKTYVAVSVAKLYFCKVYIVRGRAGASFYFFVGSESNRTFAAHIAKMIIDTVQKEASRECRKVNGKHVSSFITSFTTGAYIRIKDRCEELITNACKGELQDDEGNTLPALVSQYEEQAIRVDNFLNSIELKQGRSHKMKMDDYEAYSKGKEVGSKVQLSRALQSELSPKMIGVSV